MDFSVFKEEEIVQKYDGTIIKNKIKVIRLLEKRDPRNRKIERLKLDIFRMSKNIVVKNINNYLKYTRNSIVCDICNGRLEMESEAYITFSNCIEKFNTKYDFYWYFNKALTRNFYRMFERQVQAYEKEIDYRQQNAYRRAIAANQVELEVDIYNFGFNEEDEIVLQSKLNGETKEMFTKNNPDFQISKYYNCLKKVKKVLTTLIENDDI